MSAISGAQSSLYVLDYRRPQAFERPQPFEAPPAIQVPRDTPDGAEAGRSSPDSTLEQSLTRWAQVQRAKELEAEARQQVLADLGLTEGDLLRMDANARKQIERRIQDLVRERLTAIDAKVEVPPSAVPRSSGSGRSVDILI